MRNQKRRISVRFVAALLALVMAFCLIGLPGDRKAEAATINRQEGSQTVTTQDNPGEMQAVWLSFLEYKKKRYTKRQYTNYIHGVMTRAKSMGFNTVIMHVRPFSDAIYASSYFPWSKYLCKGRNPGYDPLAIAVEEAHAQGLQLHAWINPYRISTSTKIRKLPKSSPARRWGRSRNVLKFHGMLYYNPSKQAVRDLITAGVREIVQKYDVDGIHFDDYFYPSLGSGYRKNFDAREYRAYKKAQRRKHKKAKSIVSWRRENVNMLVRQVYGTVKSIKPNCQFGISPAGNLSRLYSKSTYYTDVRKWMRTPGYIDYICPQIYWSFSHRICPYRKTVRKWMRIQRAGGVKVYIGLAGYRAGAKRRAGRAMGDIGWARSSSVLKKQVQLLRQYHANGFSVFSYQDLNRGSARKEMRKLKSVIK